MKTISLDDGRTVSVRAESWPIAGAFTISRGEKRFAEVVVVEVNGQGATGRGECVPYPRYGENVASVTEQVTITVHALAGQFDRVSLAQILGPGAARNALDCALWDHEAKVSGVRVHARAGITEPQPIETAYTIGLGSPEEMAAKAASCGYPLLKLKLGREGDEARLRAVSASAPNARLIVDANEGWCPDQLAARLAACVQAGVELVEQPLPAENDAALREINRPICVCADESAHDSRGLAALRDRYNAINIKLDKTGGLTEALAACIEAQRLGLRIMVGCMVSTSLAMAPAVLLAQQAEWVDLDGPLMLERDRSPGLTLDGPVIKTPDASVWG